MHLYRDRSNDVGKRMVINGVRVHPGLFLCCSPQGRAACPESGCKLGVSQMYGSHNKIHFRVFASVPHKLKNKEPNYITHSLHGCTHSLFLFTLLLYSSFTPPLLLLYSSFIPPAQHQSVGVNYRPQRWSLFVKAPVCSCRLHCIANVGCNKAPLHCQPGGVHC